MRKGLSFMLFIILILTLSLNAAVMGAARIDCEEPVWNFGKAMEGERPVHDFKIKNTGDEVLEIKRVRGSCGCTAAKPSTKTLKPGEEAEINVNFNTSGRSGKQTKYVYVYTNDSDQNMFKLTVAGEVQRKPSPRIIIRPSSWSLQKTEPGKTKRTTITIMNTGEKPLEIKSITTSSDALKANLLGEKTIPPNGRQNLELSYLVPTETKNIREKITIDSNDPKRQKCYLSIYGRVEFQVSGLTVALLGTRKLGEDIQIDLHIQNAMDHPVIFTVPDAREPNQAMVPRKGLKKFSVTMPEEVLQVPGDFKKEQALPKAGLGAYKNLKIELSLPIPESGISKTITIESPPKPTVEKTQPEPTPPSRMKVPRKKILPKSTGSSNIAP